MRSKLFDRLVRRGVHAGRGDRSSRARSLTGTVSETMCGANHMGKDAATCTRRA